MQRGTLEGEAKKQGWAPASSAQHASVAGFETSERVWNWILLPEAPPSAPLPPSAVRAPASASGPPATGLCPAPAPQPQALGVYLDRPLGDLSGQRPLPVTCLESLWLQPWDFCLEGRACAWLPGCQAEQIGRLAPNSTCLAIIIAQPTTFPLPCSLSSPPLDFPLSSCL